MLICVIASPLAVLAYPGHAAASGTGYASNYTVFQIPAVGSGGFLGHDSGLVYGDYQEFQVNDATDSVSQLSVPNSSDYWTSQGVFNSGAMNSLGVMAGQIDSGPNQGDAGIWANGSLTVIQPLTSPVDGVGTSDGATLNAYPCTTVKTATTSADCPGIQSLIQMSSINDSGDASGTEYFHSASVPTPGVAYDICSLAVYWDGSSLHPVLDTVPIPSGETSCTYVYPQNASFITNSSLMGGGEDCPPNSTGLTFEPSGAAQSAACPSGQASFQSTYNGLFPCSSDLGDFAGADFNASDVAVGQLLQNNQYSGGTWLFSEGQPAADLSTLTGPLSAPIGNALAIDNSGDILGDTNVGGAPYLYVAIPEPPSQPTVAAVSPNSGPIEGGTNVTVTGSNLELATEANFMFTDGKTVSVPLKAGNESWDGTSLTVPTPNVSGTESVGAVADITITGQGGTSSANASDQFTFTGLQVTGVSADAGPLNGGTTVTITGQGLDGASGVSFQLPDGVDVPASFNAVSSTELTATTPPVAGYYPGASSVITDVRVDDGSTTSPINSSGRPVHLR